MGSLSVNSAALIRDFLYETGLYLLFLKLVFRKPEKWRLSARQFFIEAGKLVINSANFLVLPKILATTLLNPLLTLMSFIMGLIGGYLIISLTGMIKVADYIEGLRFAFNGYYITYSIVKTAVFSFIISSISSYYGYYAAGGSLGVGRSATQTIVAASAAILIFNLHLTRKML